jgi:DNA polymerase III subunit chi
VTEVHFIVAEDNSRLERKRMVCALAEHRWAQARGLLVQAASAQELAELDDLLWTYNDISFLMHATLGKPSAGSTPILLTWDVVPDTEVECLVNLGQTVPAYVGRCKCIYELVDHDPHHKGWARQRYLDYKAAGCEPQTRRISNYNELAA